MRGGVTKRSSSGRDSANLCNTSTHMMIMWRTMENSKHADPALVYNADEIAQVAWRAANGGHIRPKLGYHRSRIQLASWAFMLCPWMNRYHGCEDAEWLTRAIFLHVYRLLFREGHAKTNRRPERLRISSHTKSYAQSYGSFVIV